MIVKLETILTRQDKDMDGNGIFRRWAGMTAIIAAAALAGCAASPDPKPEIESARTLVTQAEQSGAPEFASGEMQSARERLQMAEEADAAHKDDDAQRYAAQAGVNAKLAMAKAAAAKADASAKESSRSVEALRDEANRPDPASATNPTTVP
jgi:hypothetical protein